MILNCKIKNINMICIRFRNYFVSYLTHFPSNLSIKRNSDDCLRSVAGLVIQATGRTEFEDGLRPGSPGGVLSDNPSVRTSSLVTPVL